MACLAAKRNMEVEMHSYKFEKYEKKARNLRAFPAKKYFWLIILRQRH